MQGKETHTANMWYFSSFAFIWIVLIQFAVITLLILTAVQVTYELEPGTSEPRPRDLYPFDKEKGGWEPVNTTIRLVTCCFALVSVLLQAMRTKAQPCTFLALIPLVATTILGFISLGLDAALFSKARNTDCQGYCEQSEYIATLIFTLVVALVALCSTVTTGYQFVRYQYPQGGFCGMAPTETQKQPTVEETRFGIQSPTHTTIIQSPQSPRLNLVNVICVCILLLCGTILIILTATQNRSSSDVSSLVPIQPQDVTPPHHLPRNTYIFNPMKEGNDFITGGWKTRNTVMRFITCAIDLPIPLLMFSQRSTHASWVLLILMCILCLCGWISFGFDTTDIVKSKNTECPNGYACWFSQYWATLFMAFYVALFTAVFLIAVKICPNVYQRRRSKNLGESEKENHMYAPLGATTAQPVVGSGNTGGGSSSSGGGPSTPNNGNAHNYSITNGHGTMGSPVSAPGGDSTTIAQATTTTQAGGAGYTAHAPQALTGLQSPTTAHSIPDKPSEADGNKSPKFYPAHTSPRNPQSPAGEYTMSPGATGSDMRFGSQGQQQLGMMMGVTRAGLPVNEAPPPPNVKIGLPYNSPPRYHNYSRTPFSPALTGTSDPTDTMQPTSHSDTSDSMMGDHTPDKIHFPPRAFGTHEIGTSVEFGDPYVGIMLEDDADPRDQQIRATVVSINEGGPADEGGLQVDDVLTKFDGYPISCKSEFGDRLNQSVVGTRVVVEVYRASEKGLVDCWLTIQNKDPLLSPYVNRGWNSHRSRSVLAR